MDVLNGCPGLRNFELYFERIKRNQEFSKIVAIANIYNKIILNIFIP